ncbi:MAG: DMT family transporter [Spirochaetaceae bacterium]|nr:DMT family transporter [Spirochaetaceae bacterium]
MDTLVFLLVIFAAFTHALWNFFSKKVSGNFTIFWYGVMFANSILFMYTIYLFITNKIEFVAWVPIIVSGVAHGFFYVTMLYAYSKGDISSVYPISRGTGVIGTAILSYFFLKEIITTPAAFGILTVCVGIILIGFSKLKNQNVNIKFYLIAILPGIFIFIYAIADKIGVQYMHPVAYISIVDMLALAPLAGVANKNGFSESIKLVKKHLKESLIIGIGSSGTYLIILFAMRLERASYIFSVREFSIVIASIMGFIFLKEKPTLFKIIGIVSVAAGLLMIKMG